MSSSLVVTLSAIAGVQWSLYGNSWDIADLDATIFTTQTAVDIASGDLGSSDADLLFDLGVRLDTRFRLNYALDDLHGAVSGFQRAVELTSDDDPNRRERLNRLSIALFARFDRVGELDDLHTAITASRCAVESAPDDHTREPALLSNYGASVAVRFGQMGELEDINCAIGILRRADELVRDSHPDKPQCSHNLGKSLLKRFRTTGEIEDLEQGISSLRRAVELMPNGYPHKSLLWDGLGSALLERFKCTGALEDVEEAIWLRRRVAELTPDDHPDKPQWLQNLGSSLIRRSGRTGEFEDIEQALWLCRRAVELTPDDHPDMPSRFDDLGHSLCTRFERTGELEDLEQCIWMLRRAVELTPDGHPNKLTGLNNQGNSLCTRFERTGELEDLEQGIWMLRRAVELTPDGHPGKPSGLTNLGTSLSQRFIRRRNYEGIEEAVWCSRRASELTADDHPEKPVMLLNLSQDLLSRFKQTRGLADVEEAISAGHRAIELSPEGHLHLSTYHYALALGLVDRYKHSGDIDDINKAISLYKKATELVPDSDTRLSNVLLNLASAQSLLFMCTHAQTDFDAAVESIITSTLHPSASPSDRFESAKFCARMLFVNPSFSTMDSLLSAHQRVISTLPEIVWLGYDIHRRYEESSQLGELVTAAVSSAIAAGSLAQAVEWLEAGRALIWTQVSSLRMPLDELRAYRPNLADELQSVQARIQSSAYSAFTSVGETFGGIVRLTANTAADSHRGLVIKYDKLMKDIRACPGFEDFLRPKRFESLIFSLSHLSGPVVFINVHSSRCDALILCPGGAITSVVLPDLSSNNAAGLHRLWLSRLVEHMSRERSFVPAERMHGYFNPFTIVLERLWLWVVFPVLVALDLTVFTTDGHLPHITWCPTGPLAYLPLHAAGIYKDKFGPRVFDFVVSSYTPSLTALLRSCEGVAKCCSTPELLLVTQPATPGHTWNCQRKCRTLVSPRAFGD
ncbi:hypothetical protein PENSPDRAFT_756016 [Peniophora sp. CONT]|nr:hypothetical protein PENSPDRAFT_756016 [Peniophora sp. CONT]